MAITTDKDGQPLEIGTVVMLDETLKLAGKIGAVAEVSFRQEDSVYLKLTGVRNFVDREHVSAVDFTEFETVLFNAFANRKVYLTEEQTRELARELSESMAF